MQKIRYDPDISGGSHIQGNGPRPSQGNPTDLCTVYHLLESLASGSEITTNIKEMVDTVKQGRNVPNAIGFGISHSNRPAGWPLQADRVIVGSAIVKMVARYGINCVGACLRLCKDR